MGNQNVLICCKIFKKVAEIWKITLFYFHWEYTSMLKCFKVHIYITEKAPFGKLKRVTLFSSVQESGREAKLTVLNLADMIWEKTMSQKPIEFYYSNASSGRQQ